jgi:hypothetical protein
MYVRTREGYVAQVGSNVVSSSVIPHTVLPADEPSLTQLNL